MPVSEHTIKKWHALYVRSRAEKKIAAQLEEMGFAFDEYEDSDEEPAYMAAEDDAAEAAAAATEEAIQDEETSDNEADA